MKRSARPRLRLDFTSVAGVPIGLGFILIGQVLEGGTVHSLLQVTAAVIVFGGTIGAVLLSFSLNEVKRALRALKVVFLYDGEPPSRTIAKVIAYAMRARKEGLMSLEPALEHEPDPFLRKGLSLAVDGISPHMIRDMLTMDIASRETYDETPAKVFEAAGGYAPTIGILGAVLGLIHVMENLAEPNRLGAGIAVAFVATIYGVGSANLIFLPIATKLRNKARRIAERRELLLEGILAIQEGLNPRLIEEKLEGFAGADAAGARVTARHQAA